MTMKILTRHERLGEFLRLKRNSITPQMLGLPKPARSRTPGLRREDVAEMADISTVWYAKLERGKAERVSRHVIMAIARSLRCDESETRYLLQLSGHADVSQHRNLKQNASSELSVMLEALNPLPAMVSNDFRDILLANEAFVKMVGFDVNALAVAERNSIYLMSHHAQWQRWLKADCVEALQDCMRNSAARIRAAMVSRACEAEWQHRLDSLTQDCPQFKKIWSDHGVRAKEEFEREYQHHVLGDLLLRKQHWNSCANDALGQLVVYIPLNDADRLRLGELFC